MSLTQLYLRNVRNIRQATIKPCSGLNIIFGENGAGKTSLLEGIDILSRGRSFRSRQIKSLLSRDQSELLITGEVFEDSGVVLRLGIEKTRKTTRLRFRGESINTLSTLAAAHPVQILTPDSHTIIEGAPAYRRAFLDWGVFHVKHEYLKVWQANQRTLKQRNAALRDKASESVMLAWNEEFSTHANKVDAIRREYFEELLPIVNQYLQKILNSSEINLEYRRGWPADCDLSRVLSQNLEKDRIQAFTQYGPHRADISIRVNRHQAASVISRGQQKLLVACLILSQTINFQKKTGKQCVLLVDDLNAELDQKHCNALLGEMAESGIQVFITTLNPDSLDRSGWKEVRMFHVEHGSVREMVQ